MSIVLKKITTATGHAPASTAPTAMNHLPTKPTDGGTPTSASPSTASAPAANGMRFASPEYSSTVRAPMPAAIIPTARKSPPFMIA